MTNIENLDIQITEILNMCKMDIHKCCKDDKVMYTYDFLLDKVFNLYSNPRDTEYYNTIRESIKKIIYGE